MDLKKLGEMMTEDRAAQSIPRIDLRFLIVSDDKIKFIAILQLFVKASKLASFA